MVPEGQYLLGDLECDLTPPQEALLQDLLNGFDPEAGGNASLNTQLDALSKARRLRLKPDTAEKICRLAFLELEGFGMFSPLLADDDLEEIAVVGVNMPVFVCHRIHGWMATNAVVQSAPYLAEVINKMARPLGRRLTFENPRLSAVLADGSRLHACFSPIAKDGFVMNLRKFRRKRITLTELLATDFLDVPSAAFLNAVMISDASVLIAGNTASGKTTFLNALSEFVPEKERVVVLEESPELFWPHAHQVRLVASVSASLGQLVADSLRLRPDRVVVGEVRTSEETRALFDVLLSGHARGAYGTFHADNAQEALLRLTSLGIRREELDALDVLAVARRTLNGRRLTELCFVQDGKALPVFSKSGYFPRFFSSRIFSHLGHSRQEFLEKIRQFEHALKQKKDDFTSSAGTT